MLFFLFLNRLFFPFTIHVKPLHPDSSGGMGSLGRIGWMVVGIMVVGALLNFSAHGHFASPITVTETVALTIVYLVLVVSLMIGWLALPHQVMVQARNAILEPLTNEYERVLMETMPSAEEETSKIAAATERLWTW